MDYKSLLGNSGPSVFSVEKVWKDPGPISKKYYAYLTPDSRSYASILNPIFSFEIEDISLRFFHILSLRDGVYPLLRFFAMNPVPHHSDANLIIDSTFAELVPVKWRSKIHLRELYVEKPLFDYTSEECLFLISPDADSQPLDLFKNELLKYKTQLNTFKKLSVYFSSTVLKGEDENHDCSNWGYKLLQILTKNFPDKDIEVLDWASYEKKNASQLSFLIINPLKFYFSDSYLAHDLAQRGAQPLIQHAPYEQGLKNKISINHGYNIYPWKGPEESIFNEDFHKVFEGKNINVKPVWDEFRYVKLTTPEFKDFAIYAARKILNT